MHVGAARVVAKQGLAVTVTRAARPGPRLGFLLHRGGGARPRSLLPRVRHVVQGRTSGPLCMSGILGSEVEDLPDGEAEHGGEGDDHGVKNYF